MIYQQIRPLNILGSWRQLPCEVLGTPIGSAYDETSHFWFSIVVFLAPRQSPVCPSILILPLPPVTTVVLAFVD